MHWRMTKPFLISFFGCCVTFAGLPQAIQGQEDPKLETPSPVIVGETPASDSIPPTIARPPGSVLPSPVLPPPTTSNNKPRPSLGIVAEERADKKGLTVISVSVDSPAGNAGVRVGDVLTALNGRRTNSIEDVKAALAPLQAGDKTTIEVTRVGTIYELRATMSDAPPPEVAAPTPSEPPAVQARPQMAGRGVLGIGVADAGSTRTGSAAIRGALVTQVTSGSPADAIGLRPGDVVVSIDGKVMYGARELTDYMLTARAGDEVEVGYYRDRTLQRKKVTLSSSDNPIAALPVPGTPTNPADKDRVAPIVIGPDANVGEILEGVGRTIDSILGGRRRVAPQPGANSMPKQPQQPTPAIPTPRSLPAPPPLPEPTPVTPEKPSGETQTADQGSDREEVIRLRNQMQQMLKRIEMLEQQLKEAKKSG